MARFTPQEVWDKYRELEHQDMWHYSPYLRQIARGNIMEIGVREGVSTAAFLLGLQENGGHLYSIDRSRGCSDLFNVPEWTFILGDSFRNFRVIKQLIQVPIDVLLIDGDHHYQSVMADLRNFTSLVRMGGLILAHDVEPSSEMREIVKGWYPVEECRAAYDDFLAEHPKWEHKILPGHTGLGVIVKGE